MRLFVFSLVLIAMASGLIAVVPFDDSIHVPNVITVCFDAESINSTTGDIVVNTTINGQIQTGLSSFDSLAVTFNFIGIQRLFFVEDTEWYGSNGAYPMNVFSVTLKDNQKIEQALDALSGCADVIFAEYQGIVENHFTPDDERYSDQLYHTVIQSADMWDIAQDASEIIVAIVDSGVKWNHFDLRDNIYLDSAELPFVTIDWINGSIIGDGLSHDNNSYPNDVMGWDFTNWNGTPNPADNNPFTAYDGNKHGTHVAGAVGAMGNNSKGVSGIAMNIKLLITKHGDHDERRLQGIYYSADKGAHVINCSWGIRINGAGYLSLLAVEYANYRGSLVVASAGNSNTVTPHYPAATEPAFAVGSTTLDDFKYSSSNYGQWVDVMAPGVNLLTTSFDENGDTLIYASGTSMAAPIVSGIAAMIKATHPEFSVEQIKQRIMATCDTLLQNIEPGGDYEGLLGSGRVNAFNAIIDGKSTHQLSQGNIHWLSFPYLPIYSKEIDWVLDKSHNNKLLVDFPLNKVEYIYWNYGSNAGSLYWNTTNGEWVNRYRQVDSRYGYKLKMTSLDDVEILVAGYPPSYFGADDDLMVLPSGGTQLSPKEIWLGYFMSLSEFPLIALQDIEPYLVSIKTQRWTMVKYIQPTGQSYWVGRISIGGPMINQGDAVILQYVSPSDLSFRWSVSRDSSNERYEHPIPIHFEFEEQLDYIPIYVSVSDDMKNFYRGELGLFIDDVCYGAAVVYSDTVQVSAYILETDIDENAVVDFRYHEYNSRSSDIIVSQYQVHDKIRNVYQNIILDFSEKLPFYMVSFSDEIIHQSHADPIESLLYANYPNPFNPSTTISYSLAETGHIKISIFNIKGQLVKTLINEVQESGIHSVAWNGEDTMANHVSSGIYFYKMETKQRSDVKKMLLIK